MNQTRLRSFILMGVAGLVWMNTAKAGMPLWTIAPVPGYPASLTLNITERATIKYTVTNQSHKTRTLLMKPIQGIISAGCASPLGYHQSCTLTLMVNGSGLIGDVFGGPIICNQNSQAQCYQPSQGNSLAIRLIKTLPPSVQYKVIAFAGSNGSISPRGMQAVNTGATLTFTATPDTGYGVHQWLVDGTLVQTGGTTYQLTNIRANHNLSALFERVTLTPGVSTLALSINCQPSSACTTTQHAALTGRARKITIQNTGSITATNVRVTVPNLPSGTEISANSCTGSLNPGASCTITLTPGSIASADSQGMACTSGTRPVASTVTVTADEGISSQIKTYVLGYGCIYQGGFLYAVKDAEPSTSSIGGTVVALVDQAARYPDGIAWDADPSCALFSCTSQTNAWNFYYGQNLAEVTGSTNPANTGTNGPGNTFQIVSVLNGQNGNGNNPATYAAGACIRYTDTAEGRNDWYLPAICEMGPPTNCSDCAADTQNILDNIPGLISDPLNSPNTSCSLGTNCLAGDYWSSTENSTDPLSAAWLAYFSTGGSEQLVYTKESRLGVRCSRDLTP